MSAYTTVGAMYWSKAYIARHKRYDVNIPVALLYMINVWKWFPLVYKLYAIDKHVTWRKFTDTYRFHESIVLLQNTNKISFSLSDVSLQSDKYIQQMINDIFGMT